MFSCSLSLKVVLMQFTKLSARVFILCIFIINLFLSPVLYAWERTTLNTKIKAYRKNISQNYKEWKIDNLKGLERIKKDKNLSLVREKRRLRASMDALVLKPGKEVSASNIKSMLNSLAKQDLANQSYYEKKYKILKKFFGDRMIHYEEYTKSNIDLYNDGIPDFFPVRKKAILIFSTEIRVKETWLRNKFCYEQKFYKKQKAYQDYKLSFQTALIPIKIELALYNSKKQIFEFTHKNILKRKKLFESLSKKTKVNEERFDHISSSIRQLKIDETQALEKVLEFQKKYHQVKLNLKLAKIDILQERKLRKSIIFCNPSRDIIKLASPISYQLELRQVLGRVPANF